MFSERSRDALEARPESAAYPVALCCLLVGSSLAFATTYEILVAIGVVLLALLSLVYGALQMPEQME